MKSFVKNLDKSFIILMLSHTKYETAPARIMDVLTRRHKKICFVLLSDIYQNVKKDFIKNKISLDKIHFIDVLSSHYTPPKSVSNCVFLSDINLKEILNAIHKNINEDQCNLIVFDNISQLLFHFQKFEIQQLTHMLKTGNNYINAKKIFLMQKDHDLLIEDNKRLTNDLELFADTIIDLNG